MRVHQIRLPLLREGREACHSQSEPALRPSTARRLRHVLRVDGVAAASMATGRLALEGGDPESLVCAPASPPSTCSLPPPQAAVARDERRDALVVISTAGCRAFTRT